MPLFGPLESPTQSQSQSQNGSADFSSLFERTQLVNQTPLPGSFADRVHNRFGIDLGPKTQPVDSTPRTGTDANAGRLPDVPADVRNGVLTLKYGDVNFDRQLATATNYETIRVDTPANVNIRHWVDKNGYFFWFENGNDNATKHYYPPFAKQIWTNGRAFDLEAQRLKVDEQFATADLANRGKPNAGFSSLDKRSDVMAYAGRMAGLSENALDVLEKNLVDATKNSNNPYFRIYLADVYTAKAMIPFSKQVMDRNVQWLDTTQSAIYIDKALEQLKQVNDDSRSTFRQRGWNPPGNVLMPLDPYSIYRDPNSAQYLYGFWVGSYDQARHREAALTVIKGMLGKGVRIELP